MSDRDTRLLPTTILLWAATALVYALFVRIPFNYAYLDFGDGNYQYISWRMTEGIRLYTDILSPQPPFHLWTGALLVQVADLLGVEPLYCFRWFTLLLRIALSAVVGVLSFQIFASQGRAYLAAAVFFVLPEGYRWSQGYQSEHLELFFLCLALSLGLTGREWMRAIAPFFAVAAMWTNMSSLPFSILIIAFAALRNPFSWKPLAVGAGSLILLLGVSIGLAGEAYMENVWSNQVASIPTDPKVWLQSILVEGTAIIEHEGLFILLCLAGIWGFIQGRDRGTPYSPLERGILGLWGIASVGSAIYVVKGGTVDYIFMLAEPAIAVFSTAAIAIAFSPTRQDSGNGSKSSGALGEFLLAGCRILLMVGLFVLLLWKPYSFILSNRNQAGHGVDLRDQSEGRIVEFSDVEVRTLVKTIDHLSEKGETIWAPPFLAALTRRPIAEDLSETYLWYVRWQQNLFGGRPDPAVDALIGGLTEAIGDRALPVLLLNSRTGQWGHLMVPDLTLRLPDPQEGSRIVRVRDLDPRLEKLQSTLEEHYHPILARPGSEEKLYFQGWNERLEVWVPKDAPRLLPPWVQVGFGG